LTNLQALTLGIIQGLTEFLPISSSGHLALTSWFFGLQQGEAEMALAIGIATNTGTLLAVLLALRKDVALALSGFVQGLYSAEARKGEGWRLALLVITGCIPTALIGLLFRDSFEALAAPLPVAVMLAVTGFMLWFAPRGTQPRTEISQVRFLDALIVGITQGIAVLPGLSRSGTTIATLLWRGLSSELAARISFLMYLVVSLGVGLLGVNEVRSANLAFMPVLIMTAVSFVVGYAALEWLFAVLRRGQFRTFSPYLWVVSGVTIISVLVRQT
jgi:undecaprenyl-diphosphatase